ncbi:MAG: sporulation protein YqfD [Eubacteriales bacterium]|nr:sporulation protein YqfD [Eubacteriales bacterium]
MTQRIWQFCQGYAKIQIDGLRLVNWLDALAGRGIVLRGVRRLSHTQITARVSLPQLKKLEKEAENTSVRVRVLERRGLPVLWCSARRRGALLGGAAAAAAVLYFANCFVLDVSVQGCRDESLCQLILHTAQEQGVAAGARKTDFNRLDAQRRIQNTVPGLSFVSIEVKGVRAVIRVQQETPAPALLDLENPYEVIASRDAVIARISAVDGQALVAPGDAVRAGQTLISHIVPYSDGSVRAVHARGEVWARVWLEGEAWQPLLAAQLSDTGRKSVRRTLEWGPLRWELSQPGVDYDWCRSQTQQHYLLGHAGPRLVTVTDYELEKEALRLDEELARQKALAEAWEKAEAQLPENARVADRISRCEVDDAGRLQARVSIEILENIAVERCVTAGGT